MVSGVIRYGELESEVRFPPITMVARQPIHADFLEHMLARVNPRGEHESGVQSPRKPIDRPGTNGNRVCRKQACVGYLDAENTNPGSKLLENPLIDREPMKIELAGNTFVLGVSTRETRICSRNVRKLIDRLWSKDNRVRGRMPAYYCLKAQLKSSTHFSSRSRCEGRVDTKINRTSREWWPRGAPTND